jgi:hypothetical protein
VTTSHSQNKKNVFEEPHFFDDEEVIAEQDKDFFSKGIRALERRYAK